MTLSAIPSERRGGYTESRGLRLTDRFWRSLPLPRRPAGATPRCTHLRLPGGVCGAGRCKAFHFVAPTLAETAGIRSA